LLQAEGGPSLNGLGSIVTHLLLPFLAGQILQRWLDGWLQRHRQVVGLIAPRSS
jgi:sodium/bile acid cotransporter 7